MHHEEIEKKRLSHNVQDSALHHLQHVSPQKAVITSDCQSNKLNMTNASISSSQVVKIVEFPVRAKAKQAIQKLIRPQGTGMFKPQLNPSLGV